LAPEPVAAGEAVEIVAVQNLTLEVRALRSPAPI
jgi:membrane-bound ClpP family serine protease